MLLDDQAAPSVGALSGPLVAGNPVSGTQTVSFPASDGGSGVFRGRLLVDDRAAVNQVLDANGGTCAELGVAPDARPSYLMAHPCLAVLSGTLAVDTTTLAVGGHTLKVAVSDAAGNETVAGPRTFTVTRDAGAADPTPATGPNGAGASRAAKLSARLAGARKGIRTLGFTRPPLLRGRLLDEQGAAISGAVLDVLARQRRSGARTARIATTTTGADGRFTATLASGSSRTITVTYTAFGGDAKPAARVGMRTRVRASLTGSIAPRSPRAGQRLRLAGRLRFLPRAGVLIAIQARDGGVWRTVDTVETRAKGRYSWPYRFAPGQAGRRFVFRARAKSPNYPFDPGATKPIAVRVRR